MSYANVEALITALKERGSDLGVDCWLRWIEDSTKHDAPGRWEEFVTAAVDRNHILILAQALRDAISMEADHWSSPEPYHDTLRRGHGTLKLLHLVSDELGLEIPVGRIDSPLTPTEMMEVAGMVNVSPDGMVTLTSEAERDLAEWKGQLEDD